MSRIGFVLVTEIRGRRAESRSAVSRRLLETGVIALPVILPRVSATELSVLIRVII